MATSAASSASSSFAAIVTTDDDDDDDARFRRAAVGSSRVRGTTRVVDNAGEQCARIAVRRERGVV